MTRKMLIKGASLINGTGNSVIENCGLLIHDAIIEKVGTFEDFEIAEDVKVVDMSGKWIMPGMINSHIHCIMEPIGDPFSLISKESQVKTAIRGLVNLRKHLKTGVTYVRDLGAPDGIDIDLRNSIQEGLIEGPGMLVSGKIITMTGGHGWPLGRESDGVDECRKAAREQIKAGADIIKIMATGGVMTPGVEPGSPQLSMEEMKAAVDEARKVGKKTATHAQGTKGIKNAILAGIDSVEHGIFLDDEVIGLMIEREVYLVPTLVAPYWIVQFGEEGGIPAFAVEKSKKIMESHMESFRKAHAAGVKIAMGTDAGTPFNMHDKTAHEIKLMVQNGMAPMEAIVSSTKTAAELLGVDSVGTLEDGKAADFIVLKANPLDDIDTLLDVESVYKAGKLVE